VLRGEMCMIEPRQTTRFGRIHAPDDAWLARASQEPILDPDLPIIDTHHHM
jgi:L-fuconolactonase